MTGQSGSPKDHKGRSKMSRNVENAAEGKGDVTRQSRPRSGGRTRNETPEGRERRLRRSAAVRTYRVGEYVRAEREAPSRGSWPNYVGRVGRVACRNVEDGEIGVDLSPSGNSGKVSWFRPEELVRVPAPVQP